jgi:manganese/zinc/iron transport system permease protein
MGGVMRPRRSAWCWAFWKEFKLVTFDPDFARTLGLPVLALEVALTVMVALAIVVGLQLVGVVLMTAMLIAPAAAARQWAGGLETMVIAGGGLRRRAGVAGALISATGPGLATGPLVVLVASGIVLVSLLAAPGGACSGAGEARAAHRGGSRAAVLLTMHGAERGHDDPDYPAELGMIDAYHGRASDRRSPGSPHEGLVRAGRHRPSARRTGS